MSVKVSVIVPVYKAEKYLHRCIDSLLAQTINGLEIILIDDGSPDSSGRICDEYTKKSLGGGGIVSKSFIKRMAESRVQEIQDLMLQRVSI